MQLFYCSFLCILNDIIKNVITRIQFVHLYHICSIWQYYQQRRIFLLIVLDVKAYLPYNSYHSGYSVSLTDEKYNK